MLENAERMQWAVQQLVDLDGLADVVRDAVEDAIEEHFGGPAGELIDQLRDMADGDQAGGWPAKDREVFRRLAASLDDAIGEAREVAERATDEARDVENTYSEAEWDFRRLMEEHGVEPAPLPEIE
jgi:hypothetical protein